MTRNHFIAAALAAAALAAAPAAAHEGISPAWWLSETAAARALQAQEPRWVSGRCAGLAPRAVRRGIPVYKHFACSVRRRTGHLVVTFAVRVHVVGPRARITVVG